MTSDREDSKPFVTEKTGNAGEIHQCASNPQHVLTTNHGIPIADNQNSLRAGERGPTFFPV